MLFWMEVRYVGGSSDDIVEVCCERGVKVTVEQLRRSVEDGMLCLVYRGPTKLLQQSSSGLELGRR